MTFRLGCSLERFPPLPLVVASNCWQALLFAAALLACAVLVPGGLSQLASEAWSIACSPGALACIIWLGVGPGALAAFLQSSGQQHVPPAQAQVSFLLRQEGCSNAPSHPTPSSEAHLCHALATLYTRLPQVAFNTAPAWSALLAYLTLPNEGLGPVGWAGALAVLTAASLVIQQE